MKIIIWLVIGWILLGIAITIFEKVTGINITGNSEKEETNETTKKEENEASKEEKVYSPLECELKEIETHTYGRAKKISEYVIPLYKEPYAEIGGFMSSTTIETIVSKYLDNQLLFSEKYNDHVIVLTGRAETIGKEGEDIYISIGNGKSYHRSGTTSESAEQLIMCYLDKSDMEDESFKNFVMSMRPGEEVTLVGILKEPSSRWAPFKLYSTTLIEADGVVPNRIMNIAVNSIYKKYQTADDKDDETYC